MMKQFSLHILVIVALLGLFAVPQRVLADSAWDLVLPAAGNEHLDGATMLLEKELKVRVPQLQLNRVTEARKDVPAVMLGTADSTPAMLSKLPTGLKMQDKSEGYAIWSTGSGSSTRVYCLGLDSRGALYAAAHLLRSIDFDATEPQLPEIPQTSSAPVVKLRGHQFGYGNMNNTVDAWSLDQFDQYIRDLIVFGANAIEISPTTDPEARESVHMKSTMWDMDLALAKLIHAYGLEVWLWMAVEIDLTDPVKAHAEREEWTRLFAAMPHVDHVFVAGGDPGDNDPGHLMAWLAETVPALRGPHPGAGLWVSNQGFEHEENDTFFNYLRDKKPDWFTGTVYGPWAKISIEEMRERTPQQYQMRHYPDITHSVRCQYPVPDWDPSFAQTLGRESFNPRPRAMQVIHRATMPYVKGFLAYSEGTHDDVDKMLWSRYGWNPDADPAEELAIYGRYFMGRKHGEDVAKGLMGLEANWEGPIEANPSIAPTAALWREIAEGDEAHLKNNWRFQHAYLRALYDDYVQRRSASESTREREAIDTLRGAVQHDPGRAIAEAKATLEASGEHPELSALRAQLDAFGAELFRLIGIQLDVKRFGAMNPERGAILEFLDTPLNNRSWWIAELDKIDASLKGGALTKEAAREQVLALCNWNVAPEGGFYDDLGHVGMQPHLVREKTWEEDPGGVSTAMVEFSRPGDGARLSWGDQAQTLFGTPLKMHYEGLDPKKAYRVRVVYAGRFRATMSLTADGQYEVHGPLAQPSPITAQEFAVPREATSDGTLDLAWNLVKGRGCQVAEVWVYPTQ